jgi:hypothetical protein
LLITPLQQWGLRIPCKNAAACDRQPAMIAKRYT